MRWPESQQYAIGDAPPDGPQGLEIETVTEYDGVGRRTRVLNDSSTAVLRFYYDRLGRQTKLEYANNDAETYAYDIASRRTKLTRPTGDAITYLYDDRGLLTKSTLPGSVEQTFSYDATGRRTKADDPDTDLSWFIDAAGRVTKITDGKLSKTIVYAYDAGGRRTSLDGPEANDTQAWSYDAMSRVTKITENAANRAEWLYDLAGAPTKMTYGSGSFSTWDYDGAGRLTKLIHKKSDSTVIQSFTYRLDKVGNRTKLTLNGGDFLEFLYDKLYQLTKETRNDSADALLYSNSFFYDRLSNRTKLDYNDGASTTTTTYEYNSADQLTKSTTDGTDTTYSYDTNGAMTRKAIAGTNHDYFYDARGLVTKYTDGTSTANYAWDIQNRRVKKDVDGSVTRFLYDDYVSEILAEYDGQATPALLASYIPTGLDSNVSMTRSGAVHYFHADALQSTWNITDSTETVQNTYQFQAFGLTYGTPTETVTNTRWFTGAEHNTEDVSQTHGVRRYFASLARWNRRDPFLDIDSLNVYSYVSGNPTNLFDPLGLYCNPVGAERIETFEQKNEAGECIIVAHRLVCVNRFWKNYWQVVAKWTVGPCPSTQFRLIDEIDVAIICTTLAIPIPFVDEGAGCLAIGGRMAYKQICSYVVGGTIITVTTVECVRRMPPPSPSQWCVCACEEVETGKVHVIGWRPRMHCYGTRIGGFVKCWCLD